MAGYLFTSGSRRHEMTAVLALMKRYAVDVDSFR